ncbi:MAG: GNAT family N-acetyltransferase [Asgard group archaeon]|nr:GNAT family N-acetyltransferase [Asgard group archaeon]
MTIGLSQLYRLRKRDIKVATEVFIRAFDSDILVHHMFPDEETRKQYIQEYFKLRIRFGIIYGEVYAPSPEIKGLVVWFHRDKFSITNWKMLRIGGIRLFMKVDKKTINRVLDIGHFSTEFRQKNINFTYWYLAPVGVDPQHQGKGLCSHLLKPMLARCDKEKIPTALETQLMQNVEIYKRYGYETIAETTIPESDIPHYLMIRHPSE